MMATQKPMRAFWWALPAAFLPSPSRQSFSEPAALAARASRSPSPTKRQRPAYAANWLRETKGPEGGASLAQLAPPVKLVGPRQVLQDAEQRNHKPDGHDDGGELAQL